jgi:5-methylcytosine-specific restriction endonuclease McrA
MIDLTRERRIVRKQCSRAGRIGQAASLTLEEWIETVTYFCGRCAFYSDHPYEVLEHFMPIIYGGGTTVFNCIPACRSCNAIKNDRLPDDLRQTRLGSTLSRIQTYLDQRREQWINQHG